MEDPFQVTAALAGGRGTVLLGFWI